MTEPTNEPATPETESPAEAAARKGRGPTRPALLAADIVSDMEGLSAPEVADIVYAVRIGRTAKELTAEIRDAKREMAETIRKHELLVARDTKTVEYVERIERLPERLRRLVVLAFIEDAPPVVVPESPEVPEGEGA